MAKYRDNLPQSSGRTFLTDGGLETTLIFHEGMELPHFASFVLLDTATGRAKLKKYYESYLRLAHRFSAGFILDTPTWRANSDWGRLLGYDASALRRINTESISFLEKLRMKWERPHIPCVINGAIGPRGDGYKAGRMNADEARAYHTSQIASFADASADMVTAFTLTNIGEAIGIVRAAKEQTIPCAISFTVETDGKLIGGETLREAIESVDRETGGAAEYFMVNCAHPTHFEDALKAREPWIGRIHGIRANASTKSHQELDESDTLDPGDPQELGLQYSNLRRNFPAMRILGGCCGTDHRHVDAIGSACLPAASAA